MSRVQWSDLVGVEHAQRAIEVALAGKHSIRFTGPRLSQARNLAAYINTHGDGMSTLAACDTPCPCGFYGDPTAACMCSVDEINAHRDRVFNPGIWYDIEIEVPRVDWYKVLGYLTDKRRQETEEVMLKRVAEARPVEEVSEDLDDACLSLLKAAFVQLHMTLFQVKRTLAVAHTIARLAHADATHVTHLAEAIQYWRCRDA